MKSAEEWANELEEFIDTREHRGIENVSTTLPKLIKAIQLDAFKFGIQTAVSRLKVLHYGNQKDIESYLIHPPTNLES